MSEVLLGIVGLALGLFVVVYVVFDLVRFRRLEREWKRRDAQFWELLERALPGIKDRYGLK